MTYTVYSLNDGQTYHFRLAALDRGGKESAPSAAVTCTLRIARDIEGVVKLQGVADYTVIDVQLQDLSGTVIRTTTTTAGRSYRFEEIFEGGYQVVACKQGYLRGATDNIAIGVGQPEPFYRNLTLCTRDINGDNYVGFSELLELARAYGTTLGTGLWKSGCDLYRNGKVDIFDLVLLAKNYERRGYGY